MTHMKERIIWGPPTVCLAICQPCTVHPVVHSPGEVPPSLSEVSFILHVVEIPLLVNRFPKCFLGLPHSSSKPNGHQCRENSPCFQPRQHKRTGLFLEACVGHLSPLSRAGELPSPGRSRGGFSCAHFWVQPESQAPPPTGWHPQPGLAFRAPRGLTPRSGPY